MKKFEETNVKAADKFVPVNYPKMMDIYKNTDENGLTEYLFPFNDGTCWTFPINIFEAMLDIITKDNVLTVENESTEQDITKPNMVTEDFTLKLASIVMNKEKYKEAK